MKVGGERLIIVPPSLGYGSKKNGEIPPNSTLTFGMCFYTINKDICLEISCRMQVARDQMSFFKRRIHPFNSCFYCWISSRIYFIKNITLAEVLDLTECILQR